MTREDFIQQLAQVKEVLTRALSYYAAWKAVAFRNDEDASWTLEEQNNILGRFRGFFTPVAFALHDMALLEFVKLFDTNPKTASLRRLLSAARRDPGLVPTTIPERLLEISRELASQDSVVVSLTSTRNERLAHMQAGPPPADPLLVRDMDELALVVTRAFNALSAGANQEHVSFDFSLKETGRHAAEILEVLLAHQNGQRQKYEETTVGIALGELKLLEKSVGARVKWSEVRSYIQTFGLTDYLLQRVEEEYAAEVTESD